MPNFCPLVNGICKATCVFFNARLRTCLIRDAALAILSLPNKVEAIQEGVEDLPDKIVDQFVEINRED
ncbi:MAG: hypothetical protein UW41_C0002G0046 [Candidatus Collierbacteria bacterium GW2011_GWC2_44_18]|uniref:Uncharacterized protein n=5 Tax=Candidatus Collieribacteriota TaxID=1752725 RepID=A0A2H0DUB3_9BACT|nr:MAG: hypothetical protein UW16_C0010G0033 [Microgenomates group bacterium GW2011_GWC1_44_10]KKT49770.1 MAG: hypothetical protein UW41_C0002G0046 [Candidatus Collierbacteria bacterium GW2011_GWC2_44_18]NCP46848.1 hypothetical protein [bacterium]OIN92830.1 MAG: hypothetical protein AUJ42_00120 [Candidatus Collierbacteria bacterium CG1_02_44_10]PIP85776.1 MAG: hypothetical protein COW83_02455 [Candidatus Collierbacteria bacterium CG22_combo_CG10-13_8_21_14_all_43_12]PIS00064.1 MAG: hypothetica